MCTQELATHIDDVVHDDHGLRPRLDNGCVVGAWRANVEERRQLAVDRASESKSVPGDPSRCALTQ